jgi:hypothetical protein
VEGEERILWLIEMAVELLVWQTFCSQLRRETNSHNGLANEHLPTMPTPTIRENRIKDVDKPSKTMMKRKRIWTKLKSGLFGRKMVSVPSIPPCKNINVQYSIISKH